MPRTKMAMWVNFILCLICSVAMYAFMFKQNNVGVIISAFFVAMTAYLAYQYAEMLKEPQSV